MKQSADLETALRPFLPDGALNLACEKLREYPHHLIITQPRATKHGDFTANPMSGRHTITVNGNLNQYAFLITLMHELAHLTCYLKHQDHVRPHGNEWKSEFRQTLSPFLRVGVFPEDIARAVSKYLNNPAAATCSDLGLSKVLTRYDKKSHPDVKLLDELPRNARFVYGRDRKIFVKGERLRTRYRCFQEGTRYEYLFSPLVKIKQVG
ncbi:MAG: SprT-like domain-containing protein [Flavobacteriales bacterium]